MSLRGTVRFYFVPVSCDKIGAMARKSKYAGLTKTRADSFTNGVLSNNSLGTGGGFQNQLTGLGTLNRDKVLAGSYFQPVRISDAELGALFDGNDLAKRIVALRPKEMFRRGYSLTITDPAGKAKGGQP